MHKLKNVGAKPAHPFIVRLRAFAAILFVAASALNCAASDFVDPGADAFDGSYELATGEVVTGGYFVENAQGRYLFMDVAGLTRGGLFERSGEATLRSLFPPGITIEFERDTSGTFDGLRWHESAEEFVSGERVFAHRSRDVAFAVDDTLRLEGRLLLPDCAGPHAIVVSVHGSGPVDRHGGPYHTFFLQHGIAVLAYDKRGYTRATDQWREPRLGVLANDAAAALRFAAELADIDKDRIGLFGSSQAGWVGPVAAVAAPETDFMILRAGAALPVAQTRLHEVRQELREAGLSGLELDQAVALREQIYALARQGAPIAATDALVKPYLDKSWYRTAFGDGLISTRWSPEWWQSAPTELAFASLPALSRFAGPVLWFLAERDENVPLISTRAALQRAFETAPTNDYEVVVIDDAAHSFLVDTPEGQRFAGGFFDHMAQWLKARGISASECRRH